MTKGFSWGGGITNNSFTSFPASAGVYRDGTPLPTGRLAANGARPIQFTSLAAASASGAGGISYNGDSIAGALGGGFFSTSGGSFRFRIDYTSGTLTFGRCATDGGSIVDDGDGSTWAGSIPGSAQWAESPSAPNSPSVTPGVGQATVGWAAPSDDGASAITGYRIEYATNAGFTTGTGSKDVGVVTSDVVTGLTNGLTYYFRVKAKNAVTNAAGTQSVASSTVSAFIAAAPSAPTGLTLAAIEAAVGALWTAGADGGSAILDYEAQIDTVNTFNSTGGTALGVYTGLTVTNKTLGVDLLAPGTTYYVRVRARNAVGNGAWSSIVSASTPARDFLDNVELASCMVPGGTQVSLRGNAANPQVVQLGYSTLTGGTAWTAIATIVTGNAAGQFATPGGPAALVLVSDASGNVYIIGREGGTRSRVRIQRFERTGVTNVWTLDGTAKQDLVDTGDALRQFAAAFVPGTGGSPVASILLLARRFGQTAAGNLSYATISASAVEASSATPFIASGSDPSWMPTPPSGVAANGALIELERLTDAGIRVAIAANGWSVVDVTNGVVSTVAKAAAGSSFTGAKLRVIAINAALFAIVRIVSGALKVEFYDAAGNLLGSATIASADLYGGAALNQWDAFYDRVAQAVRVFYVADDSARKVESRDVSTVTYAAAAIVVVTSALGSASSINNRLRVPRAFVDERKVLIEASNLLTGVQSLATLATTTGNIAPAAPTLTPRSDFDAGFTAVFNWSFSDTNPADAQTAYQLLIERVSDGATIHDSGKVASVNSTRTLAAGVLTNGVAYRWKVRVYDALDAVSAYSSYGTFSASSLGTLTITDPASNNPAGFDVSSYDVVWSYSQTNGYTQAQRRVKVVRTDTGATVSDTTMQANTVGHYLVTGLLTGVEQRIEVTLVNTNGQTTGTATRLVTPDYGSPMTPTATLEVGENFIALDITNPAPSGSRPEVVRNWIERRFAGSTDDWLRVGQTGYNGTYEDRGVKSGQAYDYRIVGDTV